MLYNTVSLSLKFSILFFYTNNGNKWYACYYTPYRFAVYIFDEVWLYILKVFRSYLFPTILLD